MHLPLVPISTDTEILRLLDGSEIAVPKARPIFKAWNGEKPTDDYGGKPLLDCNGVCVFAELMILKSLEQAGWSGVWIDTYRKRFRNSLGEDTTLPEARRELLDSIFSVAGSRHGSFDVYAWRGEEILFAEAKHSKKDSIRDSQIRWLSAALLVGVSLQSLLIVEWTAE